MRDSKFTSKERLEHIIESINSIELFLKDHTKETFLDNYLTINAVLFQFTVIGEAIVRVDDTILAKHNYPWYKVRSFRNFILHEYHAISYGVVWETAKRDLPDLKQIINKLLKTEF